MIKIVTELPTEIEALHALVQSVCAERDTAIAERDQALSQLDRLRHLLRQLQRAQFGRRSEKLDPDQLRLALEDIEQAIAAEEAEHDYTRRCSSPRPGTRPAPSSSQEIG